MNKNEVGGAAKPVDDVDDDKGYYWRKQVGLRALGGVVRVRAAAAVNLVGRGDIACSAEAVPCPVVRARCACFDFRRRRRRRRRRRPQDDDPLLKEGKEVQ